MSDQLPPDQRSNKSAPLKPRRLWMRRFATMLIASVVGLLIVEVGFRWLGPPQYSTRQILPNGVPFTSGPNGLLQYQPNTNFYAQYDPRGGGSENDGRVDYRINHLGFRGPFADRELDAALRIVCLGDSFTFGEGVAEADTWPRQLERILNQQNKEPNVASINVINAGVQGHGLLDCIYSYAVHEQAFGADVVVLCFFVNDLMPQKQTIQLNDALHRERPAEGVARWSRVLRFLQRRSDAKRQHDEMIRAIQDSFNEAGRRTFKEAVVEFDRYLREQGKKFVVVIYPLLWGLDHEYPLNAEHRFMAESLEAADIPYLDLYETFAGIPAASLWAHPTDHHPNATAQRRAARAISDKLEALNWLP